MRLNVFWRIGSRSSFADPVLTGLPGLLEFWVARLLQRVIKASTLFYGQLQLVNTTPHFLGGQLALNHRGTLNLSINTDDSISNAQAIER